jgi:hypothetical protein
MFLIVLILVVAFFVFIHHSMKPSVTYMQVSPETLRHTARCESRNR